MISIPSPSKYFKRAGSPSQEEIVLAIRDIEVRLDNIERGDYPVVGRGDEMRGEVFKVGKSKL